jgi:hypothetical protein
VNSESKIVSFVLRFVYEEPQDDAAHPDAGWYSVVRHVQTDTERHFTRWQDIEEFIARYVDLSKDAKDD